MKTKYQNKQNGKVMEIIKEDEKAATFTIRFVEDGSTKVISLGTLKRWYKALDAVAPEQIPDEVYVAEVMEQKQELGIECPPITEFEIVEDTTCGDGTPLVEVGKEIAEQAKEKAKKASKKEKATPRKKSETQGYVEESKNYIFGLIPEEDTIFVPDADIKFRSFKYDGHMYSKFNWSKNSITLQVKSSALDFDKVRKPDKTANHMFDAVYRFENELTDQDKELIRVLLESARAQRMAKKVKTTK